VLVGALCGAIATGGVASCTSSGATARPPSTSRSVITRAEIDASNVSTAFDAVERLRPNFLRSHGPTSVRQASGPLARVYVDGSSMGGIDQLRGIAAGVVESIEYLPARDATTRFGTGHEGGAIMVLTRRR
jgi:hypothetical protein